MPIAARSQKVTRSHRTLTETSAEVASILDKLEAVSKISLGSIRHVPGGRRDVKFHSMTGGIKVVVRGNGAVHDLYVYTTEPEMVRQQLEEKFAK